MKANMIKCIFQLILIKCQPVIQILLIVKNEFGLGFGKSELRYNFVL